MVINLPKISMINEIIRFLRRNYQNYEERLRIESPTKDLFFINENKDHFSNSGSIMIESEYTLNHLIHTEKFEKCLTDQYQLSKDKINWIKEHGLFNFNQGLSQPTEQNNLLYQLAYYDRVTNLKNHNSLEKDATFLIHYHIPFSLFFLDINRFKIAHDSFGHSLGNIVLCKLSEKLKNCTHYNFDIYQVAIDEFFIIFPYLEDGEETKRMAINLIETFKNDIILDEYKLVINPCIGIVYYPKDSNDLQTLIKYADICMYRAKTSEYLSFSFFDEVFYNQVIEDEMIEEQIQSIIDQRSIQLVYQPIYDLTLNRVTGFEALFRSHSKFSPERIFNIALKSHLIILLDKYIIEMVIKNISEINLTNDIRFTINVTPKTLIYENIYEYINELLNKYNVSGNRLGIEITEQYLVNDEEQMNETLVKLQLLGIQIYLDDFGMGYSSIRNLMYLSYDHIKLDKRMISTVFSNKKCDTFLKNIIEFTNELKCQVILEGVETKTQLDYLKLIGVRYVQGYYFSKPLNISDAIKLLKL